jgi:LmbE family N-acetylglucosaminyl deacetylase
MASTVLVFSTYVDEIPLHAGGLIANHTRAGDHVVVVAMCYPGKPSGVVYPEVNFDNPWGRFETEENWERTAARQEINDLCAILGIERVITWNYQGDSDQLFAMDVVDKTTDVINEVEPDIVVTHWPIGDYTDFIGAGSSVLRALIERRVKKMPQVYFSETLTGRHTLLFKPTTYVDITDTIEVKKAACEKIWEGKNIDYFFNPFALPVAQFRGRECGVHFAEAYAALHGGFGREKRPGIGQVPGAHPVTMNRTVQLLQRGTFAKGVQPKTYGCISSEDAFKVYGV